MTFGRKFWLFVLMAAGCVALSPSTTPLVFAHGEDRPGPHGGHIRMPGAFHTELVAAGKSAIRVYLLDMEWKNPTIESSMVTAYLKRKGQETPLACKPATDHFACELPKGKSLKATDEIHVTANRKGVTADAAVYRFPLKFSASH